MEDKLEFASGATSTKQIRLSLVPHAGLVNVARIFEKGIETHKDKAYNALSINQSVLEDRDFLIERASHAIEHAFRVIDKLLRGCEIKECADDAGAVGWFGVMMGEAASRNRDETLIFPTSFVVPPLYKSPKFAIGQTVFYGMVPYVVRSYLLTDIGSFEYNITNERTASISVWEWNLHDKN